MHHTYINVIVVSCVLFALCRAAGILYPGVVAQQMAGGRGLLGTSCNCDVYGVY